MSDENKSEPTPLEPDKQLDLATEEWNLLQAVIGRLEENEIKIRNWMFTIVTGIVVATFAQPSAFWKVTTPLAGLIASWVFLAMELFQRVPKRYAIERAGSVEKYIQECVSGKQGRFDGPDISESLKRVKKPGDTKDKFWKRRKEALAPYWDEFCTIPMWFPYAMITFLLVGLAVLMAMKPEVEGQTVQRPSREAVVARGVDGNTIRLKDGETVRLIGVDTFETVYRQAEAVEALGEQVRSDLPSLRTDEAVRLYFDPINAATDHRDRYGRLLAYVERSRDGLDVNGELIRHGYGHAATNYPFARIEEYRGYEREARENGRGLWATAAPIRAPPSESEPAPSPEPVIETKPAPSPEPAIDQPE